MWGMGEDYVCVITPTDSCGCNKYDETVEGRGEGTAELRALFVFLCLLCPISGRESEQSNASLCTLTHTLTKPLTLQ